MIQLPDTVLPVVSGERPSGTDSQKEEPARSKPVGIWCMNGHRLVGVPACYVVYCNGKKQI